VWEWDDLTSGYVVKEDLRLLYHGWNVMAEINAVGDIVRSHLWGLDLSGSMQGAGGVGGLLCTTSYGLQTEQWFPAYDGNGNVMAMINTATGEPQARFEYDPFGREVRATGPALAHAKFRFSSKYFDVESGLSYYGYRYYNPETGRWLNRDPIGEAGGINLYGFVVNDPLNRFDPFGLSYFAYRPLDSTVGKLIGVTGGKLDDNLNTMAAHEQLFFEDSKSPENLGFFDDNQVRSDKSSLKYKAGDDTGWNDCVMRKAVANVKPSSYCLLGKPGKTEKYNCQDWADAVRAEYRRLMKDTKVVAACCPTDGERKK